jgi:hypothetical protein
VISFHSFTCASLSSRLSKRSSDASVISDRLNSGLLLFASESFVSFALALVLALVLALAFVVVGDDESVLYAAGSMRMSCAKRRPSSVV